MVDDDDDDDDGDECTLLWVRYRGSELFHFLKGFMFCSSFHTATIQQHASRFIWRLSGRMLPRPCPSQRPLLFHRSKETRMTRVTCLQQWKTRFLLEHVVTRRWNLGHKSNIGSHYHNNGLGYHCCLCYSTRIKAI